MFRSIAALGLAMGLVVVVSSPAFSQKGTSPQDSKAAAGSIKIDKPWARATPGGARVGAGYLTIVNTGANDRLVRFRTVAAGRPEVHEMSMAKGVMRMRPLANGLPVPAGGKVELKPGGYHLMLIDLKAPLNEGDKVEVVLEFEKAGDIPIVLDVFPIGSFGPNGRGGSMEKGSKGSKGSH